MAEQKIDATEAATTEGATQWTPEDVKAVETQIASDLANAGHLIILGVTAKFYTLTGDKDGATWMRRVMAGSGFTFDRKRRTDGELSSRDQAIVAMLRDNATLTTIADTLNISVSTVHAVKVKEGETSKGGTKAGAGRVATVEPTVTTPATVEPTTTPATTAATPSATKAQSWMGDPIMTAFNGIDRIGKDTDTQAAMDNWAIVYSYLIEKSGYDAKTLAAHAAKLAKAGKAITAA